jgi:hypothetical protein
LTVSAVYTVDKTIVKPIKKIVFILHISFLYVKTADNKLSIMDGDKKA